MYDERLVPIKMITEICKNAEAIKGVALEMMLTTDEKKNQEQKNYIAERVAENNKNMAVIEKLQLDEKGEGLVADIKQAQQKNRAARTTVIELAMQNKNAEAYAEYVSSLNPLTTDYINRLRILADYYTQISHQTDLENDAAATKAMQIMIGFTVIMFILLVVIGMAITRMITTPLKNMVFFCENLSNGDFRDKPRKVVSKDEFGQLADALVNMRNNLQIALKKVNESAEQVAASSEELTASSEQSTQAITQVAESIHDIAQGAAKISAAVAETSAVVEQISAGIQQAAAISNRVSEYSAETAYKTNEGKESVAAAVNQMAYIEQTVNNSSQVVAKLGDRSKEIGEIVETIAGIAGQTNLLALNAAIEAARAGEQGRGFAVVAEEVRKLAEQSQVAAKEIAELIGKIQGDTENAVVAMNKGIQEVNAGSEVVTKAGKAFEEIAVLVESVSGQVKEVSAAMQQMASGSHQIVNSVKQIDELTKAAAEKSQTVSATTEEQSASMEEIVSSSRSLANLAQDLNVAVNKFQV